MPIYEYRCSSCSHEMEALQKFSDAPLTACPSCGTDALVKKISAAGFQLKGTGWYATDFKGSGSSAKANGDKKTGDTATAEAKGGDGAAKPAAGDASGDKAASSAAPACGAGACSACS